MAHTKLRVLFIAKNVPVPGMYSSRVIIDIAHQLSGFSHVSFLYPKEKVPYGLHLQKKYRPIYGLKQWEFEGHNIQAYPYPRLPAVSYSYLLWNHLSKRGKAFYRSEGPFDLIHAHYLLPDGYLAFLFSRQYGLPYLITVRNADIRHLKRLSTNAPDFKKAKRVIQNAQQVLTPNAAYKDFVDRLFGIHAVIVPHGIDKKFLATKKEVTKEELIITTVAQVIGRKNIDWVMRAVKAYNGTQKIILHIVGEGPLLAELKQAAGQDPRIHFRGRLEKPEVLDLLRQSDIFALPSKEETFGMVYLEAAASHNAILGLKHEGVWGIFEDEREMIFCESEEDFSHRLHQLIGDEGAREALSQGAYDKACQLTWDGVSDQYHRLYLETINGEK